MIIDPPRSGLKGYLVKSYNILAEPEAQPAVPLTVPGYDGTCSHCSTSTVSLLMMSVSVYLHDAVTPTCQ